MKYLPGSEQKNFKDNEGLDHRPVITLLCRKLNFTLLPGHVHIQYQTLQDPAVAGDDSEGSICVH